MPGMGNWSGLDQVRASRPEVPVAIISASRERHDILEALARGAGGYIPKSLSMMETIAALREILRGGIFDPTPGQADQGVPSLPPDDRFDELSPRERHVLALLSDGCSNKEIARRLSLQEVTVKAHLKQVFRKLGVTNRTQAVKLVLRAGWNG
jgi:DNA-binding NarL/FixJ family response regulator